MAYLVWPRLIFGQWRLAVSYILYKYSSFRDESRDIYHIVYQLRYNNRAKDVMLGNNPSTMRLHSKIKRWCDENLPQDEFRITKTIQGGVKITLKDQETAMAFRLRWEDE